MSISPIYTAAFSTISINRGLYSDRPFGGTTEEARSTKNTATNAADTTSALPGTQPAQKVGQTETASKSTDRQSSKQNYPEKSSDSGKQRSSSGDILDLSGQPKSKSLQSSQQSAESGTSSKSGQLSAEEQAQVEKLKVRDAEVRTHEAAHLAAAGQYAQGGPKFEYQTGPDGKQYAIGGSVSIDVSPVSGDPQATIQKAQQVRAAALAPSEPSGQDQKVAAAASQMEADARLKVSQKSTEQDSDGTYGPSGTKSGSTDSVSTEPGRSEEGTTAGNLSLASKSENEDQSQQSLLKSSDFFKVDHNNDSSSATAVARQKPGNDSIASAYQRVQSDFSGRRPFVAYA